MKVILKAILCSTLLFGINSAQAKDIFLKITDVTQKALEILSFAPILRRMGPQCPCDPSLYTVFSVDFPVDNEASLYDAICLNGYHYPEDYVKKLYPEDSISAIFPSAYLNAIRRIAAELPVDLECVTCLCSNYDRTVIGTIREDERKPYCWCNKLKGGRWIDGYCCKDGQMVYDRRFELDGQTVYERKLENPDSWDAVKACGCPDGGKLDILTGFCCKDGQYYWYGQSTLGYRDPDTYEAAKACNCTTDSVICDTKTGECKE